MCGTCKRWWGDPDYRVSHMSVAWKQGTRKRQLGHGSNMSISYNTCIRSRALSRGYNFEACILGWNEYVEGSSGTLVIEEVVVHTTILEVEVLSVLDGSGTRFSVDVRVIVEVLGIFGLVGLDSCDDSGIRLVFGEVLGVI